MIQALSFENFGPFRSRSAVPLADLGLVLLRGRNEVSEAADSNGAGKTSVVHALCWGLFGEDLAGRRADAVACRFTTGTCAVQVDLSDDLGAWSVLRTRRPAKLSVWGIPGVGENEDMTSVQVKVEQRLGFGVRTFRNALVFGQGNFDRFVHADQSEQMRMLDEIQGVDFREALERSRVWCKQLNEKAVTLASEVDASRVRMASASATIHDLEEARDGFEKAKEERLAALDSRRARAEEEALASVRDLEAARDGFEKAKEERLAALGGRRRRAAEALDVARKDLRDAREVVVCLSVIKADLEVEAAFAEKLAAAAASLASARGVSEKAEAACADLKERLDALLAEGHCPSCRRSVEGKQRDVVLGNFSRDVEVLEEARKAACLVVAKAEQDYAGAEENMAKVARKILASVPSGDRPDRYVALLEEKCSERAERARREAERAAEKNLENVDAEALEEERRGWGSAGALERARRSVASVQESFEVERKKEVGRSWDGADALSAARGRRESAEAELCSSSGRLERARAAVSVAEYWIEAFGDRGIRSMLVEGVADYVTDRLAVHLEQIACGEAKVRMSAQTELKKGGARERISFATEWAWGGSGPADGSGGQDRRRDLAVFAAIQDLAESRSARPFPLKIWDEPGDSLDARGQELFLQWVQAEARRRGTGILITHSEGIASQADPDRVWTVVMGRDGARVELG